MPPLFNDQLSPFTVLTVYKHLLLIEHYLLYIHVFYLCVVKILMDYVGGQPEASAEFVVTPAGSSAGLHSSLSGSTLASYELTGPCIAYIYWDNEVSMYIFFIILDNWLIPFFPAAIFFSN